MKTIFRKSWSIWLTIAITFLLAGCGGSPAQPSAQPTALNIQLPYSSVLVGDSRPVTVIQQMSDGSARPVTDAVVAVSSPNIAAFIGEGVLSAIQTGKVTV